MEKKQSIKEVFKFPDECIKCDYQAEYGEGICSICKTSKSINADTVTLITTVNFE